MLIVSDCMLVPVRGDLDFSKAPALRCHLDRMRKGGCRRIILDMAGVEFIDSGGMAMILAEFRAMRRRGGLLSLINVSDSVMHALSLGCLTSFIPCTSKPVPAGPVPSLKPDAVPRRRLTIRIDGRNLEGARARLKELLVTLPLTDSEVFDAMLAAGEAMGNCVLHTEQGVGFLTVAVYEDRIVLEAVDNGPGFAIADGEEPETTLEHGRGIKIMRLLMDEVRICKKPFGPGTVCRLTKVFSEEGKQQALEDILEPRSA